MKKIGIIAEYNPFHNGHLHQINEIKKIFPDSLIIVILSGNFTQKGDVSIINKWDKTSIALDNNVDLPLPFSPTSIIGLGDSSSFKGILIDTSLSGPTFL